MDYLDLVEEYKDATKLNLFQKVKIITTRTRDLYAGKTSKVLNSEELSRLKPSSIAYYEVSKGAIEPDIHEKEEKVDEYTDTLPVE